ncbi:MAG: hypothetical protein AABW64_03910 [Nanoarchaeota archaeon]
MKILVISIFALAAIFLSACQTEQQVKCSEGFIQIGESCCRDADNDYICDEVEEKEELKKQQELIKPEEEKRVKAGDQLLISEANLPLRVYMQRKTHLLYTTGENEEKVYIVDEVGKFQVTIFYDKHRYKIDVDETIPVGPLLVQYRSVDPPKAGNYAILELYLAT